MALTDPMEQKWHRYAWSITNEDGNGMETATGELDADTLDRIVADHNFALLLQRDVEDYTDLLAIHEQELEGQADRVDALIAEGVAKDAEIAKLIEESERLRRERPNNLVTKRAVEKMREVLCELIDSLVADEPEPDDYYKDDIRNMTAGAGPPTRKPDMEKLADVIIDVVGPTLTPPVTAAEPPVAIPWQKGDYAWSDGWGMLVQLGKYYSAGPSFDIVGEDKSTRACDLTVPTRSQLATHIGTNDAGEEVYAWAWEHSDGYVKILYSDSPGDCTNRKLLAQALHIPIVTVGQVQRHFHGTYPPKEE